MITDPSQSQSLLLVSFELLGRVRPSCPVTSMRDVIILADVSTNDERGVRDRAERGTERSRD